MKRIIACALFILMLALPALAESQTYAPDGAGISLTLGDWAELGGGNLYVSASRDSHDPCEYSDLIFSCARDEALVAAFALSNRLAGSAHVPDAGGEPFPHGEMLFAEGGRELMLFFADVPDDADESLADAMRLPMEALRAHPELISISEPVPQAEAVDFDALYGANAIDGAAVTADALAGHRLTMLNVWATYCNPCIDEMPELGRLNADYADEGFQIIGLISDAGTSEAPDEETLDYARVIIDRTGANYMHIVPGEGVLRGALAGLTAVPTTYFVDEAGQPVGEMCVGSRSYEDWAAIVDALLSSME